MTADELDAIKARLTPVTPRPWFARENDLIGGWCVRTVDTPPSEGPGEVADFIREEDARFIAHARVDLEALVAEVDLLRTSQEATRRYADRVEAEMLSLRGERAAVVAWLRDMGQDCRLMGRIREGEAVAYYADAIERGEHRMEEK